jgi:ATP-binding cassette subfamily B protein
MGVGAVTVLGFGGGLVASRSISMGDFVAFGVYLAMLHWPMIALGWVINLFERGEASMGRIHELVDQEPSIDDRDAVPGEGLRGQVSVRNLTFAYEPGRVVLHGVSFDVAAGSTVAIVGPTGSGKSTLVSLLPRLFDPPTGTVFLDGRDVRTIPLADLRTGIGFVPQETFLFSSSVAENVALGMAGPVSDPEVRARALDAAQTAQLSRDVASFPGGFDTLVGERGITLSGGQRQRTALARALAARPQILVLDDALASVDTETEEQILGGLRGVFGSCTTFLVSHRVSTVKNADLILVLRDGGIVERGTHETLVAHGGFYADLHRRQLIEQEVLTS